MSHPIYHSDIFWHFCGRKKNEEDAYQVLCKILEDKQIYDPTPNRPPFGSHNTDSLGQRAPTLNFQMVCFADIPFAFLKDHIANYGNVGLGFSREFVIKEGAQPVIYNAKDFVEDKFSSWSPNCIIEDITKKLHSIIGKTTPGTPDHDLLWRAQLLRSYIKEFSFIDPKSVYYEREWRRFNSMDFELKDISCVIFPKKFAEDFSRKYPQIPYSISELIMS